MRDFISELMKVSKPVRYINNEINSIHKDFEFDYLKVCLIFPDLYEVGMSHLGIKILYESLNSSSKIVAERFFMPWTDALDKFGSDIFLSLESKKKLKEFDILGFSLQYELSYTNVVYILKMSQIPLKSNLRQEDDPIIIAGGPCVHNPAPLSEIIDAFFIGEMDEKLREVLEELKNKRFSSRYEKLKFLNRFDFVYVPNIDKNKKTTRYIFKNFSSTNTLKKQIVPLMPITQDRVAVEISRGCTRGCRFCQAGMIYRPVREKDLDMIMDEGVNLLECSGYKEISLMSLSASDYTKIKELMVIFSEKIKNDNISLSMPSLRADQIDDFIFETLSKVRKSGFTIAPEAGSQRMRDIINKNLTEEEIYLAMEKATLNGWNSVKLYFMVGLPYEQDEDILEIAELVHRCKRRLNGKGNINITVSVSNFVPKAFTPFQWFPQNSIEEFRHKHSILKDRLKKYKINFKFHDIYQSIMEGVFSRGDHRLNDVLVEAANRGFIFDGWSEMFDYGKWEELFSDCGLDIEKDFACREYLYDDKLPWENIDLGVTKDFLWSEYEKSRSIKVTPDCKLDKCSKCGVCDFKEIKNIVAQKGSVAIKSSDRLVNDNHYMLLFEKSDLASLLSAIEIGRVFHHIFEIVGVDLIFSRGFNPQPKLNYVYPLPVGVEGDNEIIIFRADDIKNYESLIEEMNRILPAGLKVKQIMKIDKYEQGEAETVYQLSKEDFSFLERSLNEGKDFYEKRGKNGALRKIFINDYLVGLDKEGLTIIMKIDNKGGINLLDFFKFCNYNNNKVKRLKINLKGIKYV
ncbi:MAG: TIGR03960 family B12-binding radical SAM protein [Deferribacterales bacterium]